MHSAPSELPVYRKKNAEASGSVGAAFALVNKLLAVIFLHFDITGAIAWEKLNYIEGKWIPEENLWWGFVEKTYM